MAEIQSLLVDETLRFIDTFIKKAKVTINGQDIEKEIYRTVKNGNELRKYVYLDEEIGLITRAALVDTNGRELYVKTYNYNKNSNGFVIVFPIKQSIEVFS
ncbi:hypothetical protein [Bacillus sp. JJ722]|uniref:hypothetical protein n=1 Tax=Bacillus sp. JJ722 TaxID=3122973 RepID=UPI003000F49F